MVTRKPRHLSRSRRWLKSVGALAAALVVIAGIVLPTTAAQAAGSPQLAVTISPVDAAGNTQLTAGGSISTLNYSVSYSCNVADCGNATIVLSGSPLDPNYNNYAFLTFSAWTAPVGGGTISPGSGTGAQTIALGNVAVGTTGSFTVAYNWSVTGGGVKPASFFPNGFQIVKTATGSATGATPVVAPAHAVTWQTTVPTPSLSLTAGTTNSDTPFQYTVRMTSNCLTIQGGEAEGNSRFVCAQDYDVVFHLPSQAVFVSATGGGVYNQTDNTVEWSQGPQVGNLPAIGWSNPDSTDPYVDHLVKVTFPAAAFSPSGTDSNYCNFTQTLPSTVNLTMTYLGLTPADDSNVKTASTTQNTVVQCISPFAKGVLNSKQSTFTGPSRYTGNVSPVIVQPAANPSSYYWLVSAGNEANVPGVAVITDNPLSVNGTSVTKIEALSASLVVQATASIDWVRNDGVSGTSTTGTVTAPAGTWFTSAVVHSATLAAANTLSTGTNQTTFYARFSYTVNADAPVGTRVTNTASAVIQYPGTTLPDLSLGSQSGSLEYEAPFGRGIATKAANNTTVVGGVDTVTVPTTGSVNAGWAISAYNTGNVPGVAVINDQNLDLGPARVTVVADRASPNNTVAGALASITLNTGVTLTGQTLPYTAVAGTWITGITVTSSPILASNALTTQNDQTSWFQVVLTFAVPSTTPVNVDWTNTAAVSMTYPGMGVANVDLGSPSHLIHFQATTVTPPPPVLPHIVAELVTAATPEGGGLAVPGRNVDYAFQGATANIPAGPFTPEYVFIAPTNWAVVPGSANFPNNDVPPGVMYNYQTVTISGVARSVVIATWPAGTTFGAGVTAAVTTPVMDVSAQPTFAAVPGTTGGAALGWFGDSANNWTTSQANYTGAVTDTSDVDGDGLTTEGFSQVGLGSVTVGSASQLSVVKQICQPDSSASDGCDWISDPNTIVGVDPDANDIGYRIQLTNSGNTTLTNLVGYDVLPYLGDTGTSAATAATSRGSTFAETLSSITGVSGATLSYSDSTNPCRAEVYPSAPGCSPDWTASATGAKAMKISGTGSLAPGATATVTYLATVAPGAAPDSIACNSVAASVTQIGTPTEPRAVCAGIAEADLQLAVPDRLPLQSGRPGILPFTVTNLAGGSAVAPGTVSLDIPAGLTVTDLAPSGWSCAASPAATVPLDGPVTLSCTPVNADGSARLLASGVPDALNLPVVPTLASGAITVPGTVSGTYFDPDSTNNDASGEFEVVDDLEQLALSKTDGLTAVSAGQQVTYTLTATNLLVGEAVTGATITDALPVGETFVSASDGGTWSAGAVTWNLATLAQAGITDADGDGDSGNPGSSAAVTVTVKIAAAAASDVTNTASVSAPDPTFLPGVLTASASDTDAVRAVTIAKTSNVPAIGVTVGDTITYTVTETNVGSADYTAGSPATIADDLSGILNEASFVGGSAQVKIDGGAVTAVSDPTAGVLMWSGALSSGTAAVLTYRVHVTAGTIALTNTVYSAAPSSCTSGADVSGLPCATVTNSFAPVLSIVKTATLNDSNGNGTADAGETISYSFVVSDIGGTDAKNVVVNDSKVTGIAPASVTIAAGTSATFTANDYTVTQADVNTGGAVMNSATASGTDLAGDSLPDSVPSVATIPLTAAVGALTLTKTAVLNDTNGNGTADVGETISYSFLASNTGNVSLTSVSVHDPKVTGISPAAATIQPGDDVTFTANDYVVTQADVDTGVDVSNTATASGLDPGMRVISSDPSTATVPVVPADPAITIQKLAVLNDANGNGTADAGETISYTFVVHNTGNVTETGVSVNDPKVTGIAPAAATIAPGAELTFTSDNYTVTQADVDAGVDVTNTATASGTDPAGTVTTTDPSIARTPVTAGAASITIVKSAVLADTNANGRVDAGETIAYSFVVTNTGNVTVHDVTVVDSKITGITPATATIAPGDQQIFTGDSYTATQADIDAGGVITNTATATGLDPSGAALPPTTPSTVQTPLADPAPALTIVKTGTLNDKNGNGKADAGETISYSFVVTNSGNVTETGVTVNDAMVTGISPAPVSLLPGQAQSFSSRSYTVTTADVARGSITNTATATGIDPTATSTVSAGSTVVTATGPVPPSPVEKILGYTGSDPGPLLAAAAFLLALGAIVLALAYRRRRGAAHR
jgi:uncharacterized repeat protein (TIGR01451 family)